MLTFSSAKVSLTAETDGVLQLLILLALLYVLLRSFSDGLLTDALAVCYGT